MRLNAVQTRTWSPFRFLVSATRTLGCDHVRVPLWSVTGTGHDDVSSIQRSTMTGKTHPATASKVISPSLGPQKAEERDMCTTDAGPFAAAAGRDGGVDAGRPVHLAGRIGAYLVAGVVDRVPATVRVVCGVLAVFDGRDLAELDACATARSWLVSFARMTPNAASAWVKRARLLGDLPALRCAALSGAVTPEHLRWVLDLVQRVGPTAVVPFDEILATLAATLAPADLKVACERIAAHLDPDGPDPDPNGAFERRELRLARVGAMMVLRGQLD